MSAVLGAGVALTEQRRALVRASMMKLVLLATFVVAYLNAILRTSAESDLTLFRLLLPLVTFYIMLSCAQSRATKNLIGFCAVVLIYCGAQIVLLSLVGNLTVWSFLLNVLAAGIFVYLIAVYIESFSGRSLYNHLFFWYCVLIALSLHQLATGIEYPIVPNRDDVARIFYGQENDTSLAIAAFMPMLFARCRRDPIALVLILLGVYVIYENSTRGILLAVAAYPAILATFAFVKRAGRRAAPLRPLLLLLAAMVLGIAIYLLRDYQVELVGGGSNSLTELVLDPVREVLAGQVMDAEISSVNVRVTFVVVGVQQYLSTFGIGIGPGAFQDLGDSIFPGLAASMHVFALQMLVELGWLYIALMVWIARTCARRVGWSTFLPTFIFYNFVTMSMSSGTMSNYFFLACATYAFLLTPAAAATARPADENNGVRS